MKNGEDIQLVVNVKFLHHYSIQTMLKVAAGFASRNECIAEFTKDGEVYRVWYSASTTGGYDGEYKACKIVSTADGTERVELIYYKTGWGTFREAE